MYVCYRMFESYPHMKAAFGPLRHLKHQDANYEDVLMSHGVRVLSVVQLVISNWTQRDKVIASLHDLGRNHLTFNAKVEYIDVSTYTGSLV